jgi:hypothetical protein
MSKMQKSIEEYEANGGWSSHFFAENAVNLMNELQLLGIEVVIGRTVIHLNKDGKKLKAYVHHNGRTREYATITDRTGAELLTVHYTDFSKLSAFIKEQLCHSN